MDGLQIGKAAIDAYGPNIGVGLGNTFAHIDVRGYAEAWNYGGVEPRWIKEIKDYQLAKCGQTSPYTLQHMGGIYVADKSGDQIFISLTPMRFTSYRGSRKAMIFCHRYSAHTSHI